MEEEYTPDSDRFIPETGSFEGVRGEIPTCGTCYSFGLCSSRNPNQIVDRCYTTEDDLKAVDVRPRHKKRGLVAIEP